MGTVLKYVRLLCTRHAVYDGMLTGALTVYLEETFTAVTNYKPYVAHQTPQFPERPSYSTIMHSTLL